MSHLYLSSLSLSHFRSHKRVQLECDHRPIAIFGANGAGKTNILEAISLLSPGRGLRRASAEDMSRKPEALGWKVKAALSAPDRLHDLETWAEPGSNRQVKIDDKPAAQVALGRLARMVWLVPSMDRLWIEGAEGRRRFLDRTVLSFEPSHGETVLAYEKAMRERNRLLKEQVRDAHWYTALERQMAEAGAVITGNRAATVERLVAAQQGAATSFPVAELFVRAGEGTPDTEENLIEAFASSRPRDMAAGRSLVGPHRADLEAVYEAKGAPAAQCSTGEQKALLISLILANGRALADETGAPPIVLLDEVAAHLDADRRAALYDEICALEVQAWMTGTGPELFEELTDRAQHVEVTEDGGASEVAFRT